MGEALASPETRSRLAALDLEVLMETGSTASGRYDALRERYLKTIQATGMQVE
jgi:hypothetical protein